MGKQHQDFGNSIKIARERAGWSQEQLATALGTSQGTISRIERGEPVRPSILQKALDLLKDFLLDRTTSIYLPVAKTSSPSYKSIKYRDWEIASFSKAAGVNSGDFSHIVDLKRNKQVFIIGDAAGKDNDAAIVAVAIQAAFVSAIKTLNPDHITVNGIRLAIESAYRHTIPNWKAGPSLTIGLADNVNNFVEFLNFGMPTIIGNRKGKLDYHKQSPELAMLGSRDNPRDLVPMRIQLNQNESLFLFSDGFIESFESIGPKNSSLVSRYLEASSILIDDADAILRNLVEGGAQSRPIYTNAVDDMSAMIILHKRGKNG